MIKGKRKCFCVNPDIRTRVKNKLSALELVQAEHPPFSFSTSDYISLFVRIMFLNKVYC